METTRKAVPVTQSAVDGTPSSPHSGRRLRRGALGAATALLVCLAAASPALAAGHSAGAPTLRDWGSSSSQGGSAAPWWESPYGSGSSGGSGDFGAGATSQPATAAESAGVVLIDTVLPYQHGQAAGTGMVLTSSGQVLTNYHVVQGAGSIRVTVAQTGQTYQATVVGADPTQDVALIQLAGASGLTTIKPDTDGVDVGTPVTAVGNAGGTGTLTAADGEITGLDSSVTAASEDGTAPETLTGMLETNANVLAGDSGGPLFDARGRSGRHRHGRFVRRRARRIRDPDRPRPLDRAGDPVRSRDRHGADRPGRLPRGPGHQRLLVCRLRRRRPWWVRDDAGAQVSGVVSGAAAANAGLRTGDVITSLDGQAVSTPDDVSAALVGANRVTT